MGHSSLTVSLTYPRGLENLYLSILSLVLALRAVADVLYPIS